LRAIEQLLPRLRDRFFASGEVAASPAGASASVAMLTGCVMPYMTPQTNEATVDVLARNGRRVLTPSSQVCCGAMHVHNGDLDAARALAKQNIDAFAGLDVEAIVVNAGGCGSTMKEYGDLLAGDRHYAEKAAVFAAKVKDISEYLVSIPFRTPTGRVDDVATYQDSCHVAHAQRIRTQPRDILRSIPGLKLVEMKNSDRCCGSAGTYKLTQLEMSRQLLSEKMSCIDATGCSVIATANPDCMMQLDLGVRLEGSSREVVHVVELLDRAYRAEAETGQI
jgi:glycolate oxidase iron-sulfur subunit